VSVADLEADTVRLWALAHGLQLAAQNVIDVASHLASALRSGAAPADYRGAILALGEIGVLDDRFARTLAPLAGLRNVLVHAYLHLEADRLLEAVRKLDDFRRFVTGVRAFLARNPGL
jgi:uncharacterized protein YutE (UPF0331/DUF86 family)